jgi:large subunit ribosomal protein L6
MSRIGKKPIKLSPGVKITFNKPTLEVSGKGGTMTRSIPDSIGLDIKPDVINVTNISTDPDKKALFGLNRTLIANMVKGCTDGYVKQLELQGVGYRAATAGTRINLTLGFSHPVEFDLPTGITAAVEANTKITLKGADKDLLGVTADRLRKIRPPEPYKGKGIRYAGEVVTLKQGKTAGK